MDFENFVIDLFDMVDASHSREDFKEGLNTFTLSRNVLDGSGIDESGASVFGAKLEEEFGISDLYLLVTPNVVELRFHYEEVYFMEDIIKDRVVSWARCAEFDSKMFVKIIKILENHEYMTKRLFKNIWEMTLREYSTGDVGADWDTFGETFEYIVTGK